MLSHLQVEFINALQENDTLHVQPAENLLIYANTVQSSLLSALRETYPLLDKLLGENYFSQIANDYVHYYPSRSANLHDYGAYFAEFLERYPNLQSTAYLFDVAQFEWTAHTLRFAPSHAGLDTQKLANLSEAQYEHLQLQLHPACAILVLNCPILTIIELCENKDAEDVVITSEPSLLLMFRRDLELILRQLDAAEYAFLQAVSEEKTLQAALECALNANNNFDLTQKLSPWIQEKLIVDIG